MQALLGSYFEDLVVVVALHLGIGELVAFLVVTACLGPSYLVEPFLVATFLVATFLATSYQAIACLVAFGVPYWELGPFLVLVSWQGCKLEGPLERLLDCRQGLYPCSILEEPSLVDHHLDWEAGPEQRNPLPQAMAHTGA